MRLNYLILLIAMLPSLQAYSANESSTIVYKSVEQVFDAMEANPAAARTDYEGWIIYNIANGGSYTLWSITPQDHPANPTAIRRDIVSRDGKISIEMNTLCQAAKPACDALVEEFREINDGIKQRMESQTQGS